MTSKPKSIRLPTIERSIDGDALADICEKSWRIGLLVQDLSSEMLLGDFARLHHSALCYSNANKRTLDLLKHFASEIPCNPKRGRGKAGYYFEFEVLFLYCQGYDTKLIAKLLSGLFKEDVTELDLERMANRCVQLAKKRDPTIAFAAAAVSQKAKDYAQPGTAEKEAIEALRRLGIGTNDTD